MLVYPIGHESLQSADGDRAVQLPSIAVIFTGMITDPSHGGREGVILFDHLERFPVAPSLDQSNIALGACLGWTGVLARARTSFSYQESIWHRLRIGAVDRLPLVQSSIEFIREENGANFRTVIAAGTFLQVDVARTFPDLGPKTPGLPFERKQLGVWGDLDVEMSACLDQFRGEDTHRAVVGGKSLVELRHGPTNGRRRFQKINIVAGFSEIEGGLNSGNPSSYHQNRPNFICHSTHRLEKL
jgi:hypothetical protein